MLHTVIINICFNTRSDILSNFLPVTPDDVKKRGWSSLDFIYISGDAYVDHPSFGHAIITRLFESMGFKVGIIPQPDWHNKNDFMRLGKPNIAFLVASGNIDSMVNHYTSSKKEDMTICILREENPGTDLTGLI